MTKIERNAISGKLPRDLANGVASCIRDALARGMAMDEALCVICGVISDHARGNYGDAYVKKLADILIEYVKEPIRGQVVDFTFSKGPEGRA